MVDPKGAAVHRVHRIQGVVLDDDHDDHPNPYAVVVVRHLARRLVQVRPHRDEADRDGHSHHDVHRGVHREDRHGDHQDRWDQGKNRLNAI
jgi:hypothetical protein